MTFERQLHSAVQLHQAGRLSEAEAAYRRVLEQQPGHAGALHFLGLILAQTGRFTEAIDLVRRAISVVPATAEFHNSLGMILRDAGRLDEAVAAGIRAVQLKPDLAAGHYNLAHAFYLKGEIAPAIAEYRQTIRCQPDHVRAWNNLAAVLSASGDPPSAITAGQKAIALKPDYAAAHYNLANAFKASGQLDDAVASYQQSLTLDPRQPEALNNLATSFKEQGRLDEAIDCYDRAIALRPDDAALHSNRLYLLLFHPAFDAAAILRENLKWNQQHAEPLPTMVKPHVNLRDSNRPLKIGYVSSDFREHVVGRNILPLLREHDRERFSLVCYSDVLKPDWFTSQFKSFSTGWREISGMNHEQAAGQIRADGIDILVDLTLHMARNRLPVFARKPAPVQVTFAGYPGGTGLRAMDYRLTDPYLDPPGQNDSDYIEQSIRLPDSFWCYDPQAMAGGTTGDPDVNALPSRSTGYVTFGCLNNFCKINAGVLELWSRLMNAVPDSRLLLLAEDGSHRAATTQIMAHHGVAAGRVEFVTPRPRSEYLRYYHRIDIGLDTLPYNGHSTSLDSCWMGVPVVSLIGNTVVGRAGFSQSSNLALDELVATTPHQFIAIATTLARDIERLASLRAGLRDRMLASPLTDSRRFTRGVETAYRSIWQRHCKS